jgi:hypothetical protein
MRTQKFAIAILITFVLGAGLAMQRYESNTAQVRKLDRELHRREAELADAKNKLADATKKLDFLEASKARVQVTAYALTDDFGPNPVFSNSAPARQAYAVPKHTLPAGKVLNVALSPVAERKLHARLNDTLVLTTRRDHRRYIARFVDRTAQSEVRPVVDVLFADAHQARIWGRQSFYVADISRPDSPFRQE